MKNSNDILKAIKANSAKIEELNSFIKSAKYSQRTEPEIIKAAEQAEMLKLENAFMYDNARRAYYAEKMPVVLEVFRKYAGKAYGPKTKDRINEEVKSRANCAVYIEQSAYHCYINLVPLNEYGYSGTMYKYNDFQISGRWENGKCTMILNENNRINADALKADNWYLTNCGEYIENTTEAAQLLRERFNQTKKAMQELETACKAFNEVCPSRIEHTSANNFHNYLRMF